MLLIPLGLVHIELALRSIPPELIEVRERPEHLIYKKNKIKQQGGRVTENTEYIV